MYEDGIKEEVAAILLCDLKTKKGMLKALANEIKVSTVLWRVGRPSYEQRRDMFFKCLSYLTNDEKHILSAALASAKTPFDYYDLESTQPELYKAYKMLNEDDASDRPDDYLYRKLWNDKVYHNVFTEKEQDKIFKRLLPYVSEEQFREIRGAAADIFS